MSFKLLEGISSPTNWYMYQQTNIKGLMHFLEDSQIYMILITEKMILGPVRQMVGLKVHRNRKSKTIHLFQGPYICKVIAHFGMNSANPTHT